MPNGDEEGEWLTASELKVGQRVLRPGGLWTRITSIEQSTEPTVVYNLEVEGNHNYFVGEIGILSHNCDTVKWAFGFEKNAMKLADDIGGQHLMNTSGWRAKAIEIFGDPNSKVHFSLDGVDGGSVMNMITNPHRSSTNWEIHTLYTGFKDKFEETVFYYGGKTYIGSEVFSIPR